GLDHGGAFSRHSATAERIPVGGDRGQIDGQNTGGLGRGRTRLQDPPVMGGFWSEIGLQGCFSLGHGAGLALRRPPVHVATGYVPSGRRFSRASEEKRVTAASNCNSMVPVGPWRCLPMMTSALPCTLSASASHSANFSRLDSSGLRIWWE